MTNIKNVRIDCNAGKGEIVTFVEHCEAESFRIGDASDNRSEERVTIKSRTFPTYARSPGFAAQQLARHMAQVVLASLPGVPVELYGA